MLPLWIRMDEAWGGLPRDDRAAHDLEDWEDAGDQAIEDNEVVEVLDSQPQFEDEYALPSPDSQPRFEDEYAQPVPESQPRFEDEVPQPSAEEECPQTCPESVPVIEHGECLQTLSDSHESVPVIENGECLQTLSDSQPQESQPVNELPSEPMPCKSEQNAEALNAHLAPCAETLQQQELRSQIMSRVRVIRQVVGQNLVHVSVFYTVFTYQVL